MEEEHKKKSEDDISKRDNDNWLLSLFIIAVIALVIYCLFRWNSLKNQAAKLEQLIQNTDQYIKLLKENVIKLEREIIYFEKYFNEIYFAARLFLVIIWLIINYVVGQNYHDITDSNYELGVFVDFNACLLMVWFTLNFLFTGHLISIEIASQKFKNYIRKLAEKLLALHKTVDNLEESNKRLKSVPQSREKFENELNLLKKEIASISEI